jgi:hypothetical protein
MIIRIPIRSHLLKYLSCKIGGEKINIQHVGQQELFVNESEVIHIQRELARSIYPFLVTNDRAQWKPAQLNKKEKHNLVALAFKDYLVDRKRVFISIDGVREVNYMLDKLMYGELIQINDSSIVNGARKKDAIIDFMNKYKIDEDDITIDSIRKRLWRENVALKEKLYLKNNLFVLGATLDLSFQDRMIEN